jgi:predicted nuclease of predicted toxin-antitoxin system
VRLLFDENLSEALVSALADLFPGSLHVRTLGHSGASDAGVWDLARAHDCLLVTRDEDFIQLSVAQGAPPKVIWIALGNCTNTTLIALLRAHHAEIERFSDHEEQTFLALGGPPGAG